MGLNLRHQSDKMKRMELGMALFQWATQIMGAEGSSATQVTSPNLVRKVIITMMVGE